ncbi:unnamed protein product [Paramecium sonneborni]|uniref:Uncharacterized protein n=1 Tax=Paramecium sonneborni TaxID=65129 RepID=A0A8S1RM40_9CILI|nr:unnamed protein product [Paramecium sonneborni]
MQRMEMISEFNEIRNRWQQLILSYKLELQEQNKIFYIKILIPEITYTIETVDYIMFSINIVYKEQGQTNLNEEDKRRLLTRN